MWIELADIYLKMNSEATPKVTRTVTYLLTVGRGERPLINFEALPWHEEARAYDHAEIADLSQTSLRLVLPLATFKARLVCR